MRAQGSTSLMAVQTISRPKVYFLIQNQYSGKSALLPTADIIHMKRTSRIKEIKRTLDASYLRRAIKAYSQVRLFLLSLADSTRLLAPLSLMLLIISFVQISVLFFLQRIPPPSPHLPVKPFALFIVSHCFSM